MTEFEFLAVLISIVIGLGVTHVLGGLGRIIHNRERVSLDSVHLVWTANVLLILVLNWWVFFAWSDTEVWSLDLFLVLIAWAISLYMLAVILYPRDPARDEVYRILFERNRKWFLGGLLLFIALDIVQTAIRGALFHPKAYLPYLLSGAALSAIGIAIANRTYQQFLAWFLLIANLAWALVVRRFLES